jgi:hypothetical protein
MSLNDDMARLTDILVALHTEQEPTALGGTVRRAERLRYGAFGMAADSASRLGKLCGVTAETVVAWEQGKLRPTTGQALAWLSALHQSPPLDPAGE